MRVLPRYVKHGIDPCISLMVLSTLYSNKVMMTSSLCNVESTRGDWLREREWQILYHSIYTCSDKKTTEGKMMKHTHQQAPQ